MWLGEGLKVLGFTAYKPAESSALTTLITNWAIELRTHAGVAIGTPTPAKSQNAAISAQMTFDEPYIVPSAPNNFVYIAALGANVSELCTVKDGSVTLKLA